MTTAKRDTISYAEWAEASNGWALYRSFGTKEACEWYFDRLPDDDARAYRVVDHPSRHMIAVRDNFAAREA